MPKHHHINLIYLFYLRSKRRVNTTNVFKGFAWGFYEIFPFWDYESCMLDANTMRRMVWWFWFIHSALYLYLVTLYAVSGFIVSRMCPTNFWLSQLNVNYTRTLRGLARQCFVQNTSFPLIYSEASCAFYSRKKLDLSSFQIDIYQFTRYKWRMHFRLFLSLLHAI